MRISGPHSLSRSKLKNNHFLIFFLFFNFAVLYWFCHVSTWIRHRYALDPHPEPSSNLPPCTIPLGRPSAPAPSIQYRCASNLDWLRGVLYQFFLLSRKNLVMPLLGMTVLICPLDILKLPQVLPGHLVGTYSSWFRDLKVIHNSSVLCLSLA